MKAHKNYQHPIGIIGAGLGGLSAACTLAARGHEVVVFEANPWLGGKAAYLEGAGFRFDMGPTILTLPSVLRRIFAEAGRDVSDYLNLVRLDPQWRSFFDDGSRLDLVEDTREMCTRLDGFAPGRSLSAGYQRFLGLSERLHDISRRYFFYRPIDGIRDMVDLRASVKSGLLKDLLAMRMGGTVARTIRSFVPDPRVAQMLDHFTQYVGSSPANSPAVLCGIAHMQTDEGVWYPMGGIGSIPQALTWLARELGVRFHTGAEVVRILTDEGRASGVLLRDGSSHELSAVISNMDSVRTYRELLGRPLDTRLFPRRLEPACSGVVLYLGLDRRYDHLAHHNFVFSRSHEEEFHHIYKLGEPAPDPTCYLCAPSQTDPEPAPEGGEALYVLVHTPYLRPHHDWSRLLPRYRQIIIDKLKRTAGLEDIEQRIVFERALTPQDIQTRYRVLNGAIYGLSSHGRFFGAFKPGNRRTDIPGLYLAGGAAHPGPGMPMVLMSGWIAADALHGDYQRDELSAATRILQHQDAA